MAQYTQDNRIIAVTTPLGKDVLLLAGFSGKEEMSRLFTYQLDMFSEKKDIAAKDIVGKSVTFTVFRTDGSPRYFNGLVSRFSAGGLEIQGLRHYRAEMVPWLWFLTRTADCRIFQNKTVPEIIEQIFKDLGFTAYELSLKATYVKWEYCVQYRETDFNFVSRLMEQEGIFYWFRHENGKHTMVLADQASAYKDCVEKEADYTPGSLAPNHVAQWDHQYEFRPGKWAQTDYNFETPSTSLMANTNTVVKLPGNDKYEIYDYPGEYEKKADGDTQVKIRMEEDEVPYDVVNGAGTCRTFTPGSKFTLKTHECSAEAGKNYVITSIEHTAREESYAKEGGEQSYNNTFTCIPSSVVFRPTRITHKPRIQGPQTAVVVGPSGEEIYTDKYGRVKVQFHWDREGKKDENSSCWIRVAQVWAGKRWGASFWPRIGQEVIVEFLEGDPDRPLVTGLVYNAEQMPPYVGDGPDTNHKNDNKVMGIKSNTTKGGVGFNEIRFDDTKDKQQIFVHAERNMDSRIKKDSMELVLQNRHLIVGTSGNTDYGDQLELINRDKHLDVKRNQIEKIEGNYTFYVGGGSDGGNVDIIIEKIKKEQVKQDVHVTIDGGRMEQVAKDQSLTVNGQHMEKVAKDYNLEAAQNRNEKVGQNQSLTVGQNQQEKIGQNHALEAGQAIHLKAGTTLILEAGTQLSLKVGGNFIDIGPSGVSITGTMVNINSGGSAGSGAGSNPTSPTAPTAPQAPAEANPTAPTEADDAKSGSKSSS